MRRFFLTGLLVWVPLVITFGVLRVIISAMDSVFYFLPAQWQPESLIGRHIPGLGVITAVLIIFVTGILTTNFLGQRLVIIWEGLIKRIPIVRTIYASVKQVSDTLLSSSSQAFRRAVLVPYPNEYCQTLAFVTGKPSETICKQWHLHPEEFIYVFVPTTPNPTSGFFLLIRKQDSKELDMSVDEALKTILSMGVAGPQ